MARIAIIGSGAAACFLTEILCTKHPDLSIDLFERLDEPFGLVRFGVAPDHPQARGITGQFERTLTRPQVRLHLNHAIETEQELIALRQSYDVVVLATGAARERSLRLSSTGAVPVYSANQLAAWYNNHPQQQYLRPDFGQRIAIIGHGNVALDMARLLAKSPAELAQLPLSSDVRNRLAATRPRHLYLIGRRGPLHASFTLPELRELGELNSAQVQVSPADMTDLTGKQLPHSQQQLLECLHAYAQPPAKVDEPLSHIQLIFNATPLQISSSDHQGTAQLLLAHNRLVDDRPVDSGERFTLEIDTLISAIGQDTEPLPGVPYQPQGGHFLHEQGRIAPGLYCVGWCKRGAQGVIPVNRSDAMAVARLILSDLKSTH